MKKILTMVIAVAMLSAMSAPVFAEDDVMLINAEEEVMLISEQKTSLYEREDVEADDELDLTGAVILNAKGEVKAEADVKAGDVVALFKAEDKIAYAVILGAKDALETQVDIDTYSKSETLGEFTNGAGTLALNLGETNITDLEGNKVDSIEGKTVAVFYTISTMSIPAITNPDKVIVLADADVEVEDEDVAGVTTKEHKISKDLIVKEGEVSLVPVRKIAEELGFEVTWNGEDKSVTVGTIPMGVGFKIGENAFSKAKMVPAKLEMAAKLIGDTTYVPMSFFSEILEVNLVTE